jgi:cell wall-associated NlpC family hydrolase
MQTTRRTPLAHRVAAVVAIAATGIGLAPTPSAGATVRTESAAVADEAGRALDALDRWHETSRPVHYVRYLRAREHAATLLAGELDVPAGRLAELWASTDESKQVAMLSALTQLGVPYRSLASEPGVGFDCSGLTTWAFAQVGVELPRVSRDQIRFADSVDVDEAEPGDLVYYPGHVSIYLGEDLMVHSPNSGNRVEVREVSHRTQAYGDAVAADAETSSPVAPSAPVQLGRD